MTRLIRTALIAMGVAFTSPIIAQNTSPTAIDNGNSRYGNKLFDDGYSTEAWVPFVSDDPFVWAADACLGYFMTRDIAALGDATFSTDRTDIHERAYSDRIDGRARIAFLDYPFNEYGAFQCGNMSWPNLVEDDSTRAELERWIDLRLTVERGWQGENTLYSKRRSVVFRNDDMDVRLTISRTGGRLRVKVEADCFCVYVFVH